MWSIVRGLTRGWVGDETKIKVGYLFNNQHDQSLIVNDWSDVADIIIKGKGYDGHSSRWLLPSHTTSIVVALYPATGLKFRIDLSFLSL